MLKVLGRLAEQALAKVPSSDSWADRVRSVALEELSTGNPSIHHVASRLHMSTRTLQRRLVAEGTSYSELLDRLRYDLAVTYFAAPRLSSAEVAYLLGYSDLTAFHRAVKRWTGMTPSELRSEIRSSA